MDEFKDKRQAIMDLMEYAVPEGKVPEATDLLEIYSEDRIALDLLHEFYSFLPEAVHDWIREIRMVRRRQGIFLLAVITGGNEYLYIVSSEGVEFQGHLTDGVMDNELLDFFGYESHENFLQICKAAKDFEVYDQLQSDENTCPACHAATGELHEFGCPIELCPWCGGQLVHCSCRFDKLEVDSLASEADLIRFEDILRDQGRIPYSPEQRPSFADEGSGVIIE